MKKTIIYEVETNEGAKLFTDYEKALEYCINVLDFGKEEVVKNYIKFLLSKNVKDFDVTEILVDLTLNRNVEKHSKNLYNKVMDEVRKRNIYTHYSVESVLEEIESENNNSKYAESLKKGLIELGF